MKFTVATIALSAFCMATGAMAKYKDCREDQIMAAFGGISYELEDCNAKSGYDFKSNELPTGAQREKICDCTKLVKKLPDVYFPRCNFALDKKTYTFVDAMTSVFSDCKSIPALNEIPPSKSDSASVSGSAGSASGSLDVTKKPTRKPTAKPTPKPKKTRATSLSGSGSAADEVGSSKNGTDSASGSGSLSIEKQKVRSEVGSATSEASDADEENAASPTPAVSATKAPLKTPKADSSASTVAMTTAVALTTTMTAYLLA